MKDKFSLSDRTSFSRFSQRFKTDCISDGIAGVKFLSFASAILQKFKINQSLQVITSCSTNRRFYPFMLPTPEYFFELNQNFRKMSNLLLFTRYNSMSLACLKLGNAKRNQVVIVKKLSC